jgi:hypothetical protein
MATTRKRAAAAAAAGDKNASYDVLSNLDFDGDPYAPGEQVELDPITAKELMDVGVVKPAEAGK